MMIATRSARIPLFGPSLRTGAKVIGAKLINSGAPEAAFQSQSGGGKPARTQVGDWTSLKTKLLSVARIG